MQSNSTHSELVILSRGVVVFVRVRGESFRVVLEIRGVDVARVGSHACSPLTLACSNRSVSPLRCETRKTQKYQEFYWANSTASRSSRAETTVGVVQPLSKAQVQILVLRRLASFVYYAERIRARDLVSFSNLEIFVSKRAQLGRKPFIWARGFSLGIMRSSRCSQPALRPPIAHRTRVNSFELRPFVTCINFYPKLNQFISSALTMESASFCKPGR